MAHRYTYPFQSREIPIILCPFTNVLALEAGASPITIRYLAIIARVDTILQENISGSNVIQIARELQSSNEVLEVLIDVSNTVS